MAQSLSPPPSARIAQSLTLVQNGFEKVVISQALYILFDPRQINVFGGKIELAKLQA